MGITETILLLDELRKETAQGEWEVEGSGKGCHSKIRSKDGDSITTNDYESGIGVGDKDAEYIVALHNSYEALRKAALDGERYRKALERLVNVLDEITKHDCTSHAECDVFHDKEEMYKAAISAYREAVK